MSSEPLQIKQRAVYSFRVVYQDPNGQAINLTGYTPKFQILGAQGQKLLELTEGSGITFTPLSGQIDVKIKSSQTDDLQFDKAHAELWVFSPSGDDDICLLDEMVEVLPAWYQP